MSLWRIYELMLFSSIQICTISREIILLDSNSSDSKLPDSRKNKKSAWRTADLDNIHVTPPEITDDRNHGGHGDKS